MKTTKRKSSGQIKRELKEKNKMKKKMQYAWSDYAISQSEGRAGDQTQEFVHSLPKEMVSRFFSSTSRIIQFGSASINFLRKTHIIKKRECIGYDYTEVSAEFAKAAGVQHRLVDLNEVKESKEGDVLSYQQQLNEDLSVPCDILIIRLLEYLDHHAALLLLASLIDAAQPGSIFYIDFDGEPSEITNHLSSDNIFSLFRRDNFEQLHCGTAPESGDENLGMTMRFVAKKNA